VIADWPGLKTANLYENRDLKPTTDLRAVLKGVLTRRRTRTGGQCFSRQRRREADGEVGGIIVPLVPAKAGTQH
jgi:hypothetical protein